MRAALAVCMLILFSSGCVTSLMNQRVLDEFTDALNEENESAFRRATSTRFERTAMRDGTAFRDLEILDLPTGDLSIVESEDIDDSTRKLVVTEEGGRKYQMRLVNDQVKGRWVVDDVMIRQDGKGGTRSTKSASEVMDLLLTLREFLETMKSADRGQILAMTDKEFRDPLNTLPDGWLQILIGRVTSEYDKELVRRPEAQLNGSEAVVKMPAENGFILIQLVRREQQWLIRDVEVHNRREEDHPGSIRNQAKALASVAQFLRLYQQQDRQALEQSSTAEFFETSLRVGDLGMMPLPDPERVAPEFQVRSFADQLTLLLPLADSTYRFDLIRREIPVAADDAEDVVKAAPEELLVQNVTIYDRRSQQQRTLSSTFTAPARAALFMEALHANDLKMLQQLSTQSLNAEVWEHLSPELVDLISLSGVPEGEMQVQQTHVTGPFTRIELVASTGQLLSVTMQDEAGTLCVADVSFPHPTAGILSLQDYVGVQVPIARLAAAWQQQNHTELQKSCSMDFNRLVWSNIDQIPPSLSGVPLWLLSPIQQVQLSEGRATVQLQAGVQSPVTVRLMKEHAAWVVDELTVPGQQNQQVNIRESLRSTIAHNILHAPAGTIQTVGYEEEVEYMSAGGTSVNGTASAENARRGNFTLPPSSHAPRSIPAPTPPSAIQQADYKLTQPSQDGVMRFGPAPGKTQSPEQPDAITSNASHSPAVTPGSTQGLAEMTEVDGVVYFGPAPDKAQRQSISPASQTAGRITDPSQHPIDIQ